MELRSEKVRNLIGKIPPRLAWWNAAIIIFIFIVLFLIVFFIPFPHGNGKTILQHLLNIQ